MQLTLLKHCTDTGHSWRYGVTSLSQAGPGQKKLLLQARQDWCWSESVILVYVCLEPEHVSSMVEFKGHLGVPLPKK